MNLTLDQVTRRIFFPALMINFFCILAYSSNTLPLTVLAFCFVPALFIGDRPVCTWYHAVFLLFIGYLYYHNTFIYPDEHTFAFRRKALLAFFAGAAAFHFCGRREMRFLYLLNLALPFAVGWVAVQLALGRLSFESLYNASSRLVLLTNHPTTLGMMLCICIVSGLSFLFGIQKPVRAPSWTKTFLSRLERAAYAASRSGLLVLCGMILSLLLMFPTLSKTSIFVTGIICASFLLYVVCKKWGALRGVFFCISLAVCLALAWQAVPISQSHKERLQQEVFSEALTPWRFFTFISRIPIWESSLQAVEEKPLFGIGVNRFTAFHQERVRENYERLVEEYGKEMVDGDTVHITSPHNVYLMWFAETGLIGGLLFCILFFTPLVYCLVKRSLHGEIGLVFAAYAIDFCFDDLMSGGRASSFCVTVVFMSMGYFSSILGQSSRPGAVAAGPSERNEARRADA